MSEPKLETCLSPALFHLFEPKGKTVVIIDVLRATSTICTALHHGVASVCAVGSLEDCKAKAGLNTILAAERGGGKPTGFEFGNSPYDYMNDSVAGKKLVLTTTNGTRALLAAREAEEILIGSFLNIEVISNYLRKNNSDVILFCAGWKDHFSFEDTLFAGAMVQKLAATHRLADDASLGAKVLYQQAEADLFGALKNSSHFKRLEKMGIERDLKYCTQKDTCPVLPILHEGEIVKMEF